MINDKELSGQRSALALLKWNNLVSIVEHYKEECVKHIDDALTLKILAELDPRNYDKMDEMKPEFIEKYQQQLEEAGL